MSEISISVITPCLNAADLINRCLESVAVQVGCPFEHIVIDGGSKDGTVEIIRAYAAERPHVVWTSEPDSGMANACNKGLALAKYEVISWLGPDDTFIPGAFQTVVDYFRTHLDSSFLIGSHHLVRNDGSLIRYERSKYTNREELIKYWKFWWKTIVLPFHATFYRRSVHDTLGAYDERFRFFDYEFYLRASRSFQFITLPEPLTNFRYDEGSGTFAGGWEKEFLTASREHWGYPPSWRLLKYLCSYASHARRKQNLDYRSAARLILQCLMGNKVLAGGDNS